jgi:hypothetical protein
VVEALRALEHEAQRDLQRFVMVRTAEPHGAKRRRAPSAVSLPKGKKPARDGKCRSRLQRVATTPASKLARVKAAVRDVGDPAPAGPPVSR